MKKKRKKLYEIWKNQKNRKINKQKMMFKKQEMRERKIKRDIERELKCISNSIGIQFKTSLLTFQSLTIESSISNASKYLHCKEYERTIK